MILNEKEAFRVATAELIGFGIVGTMLDGAYDVLSEFDGEMAAELNEFSSRILDRFHAAETLLFSIGSEATNE